MKDKIIKQYETLTGYKVGEQTKPDTYRIYKDNKGIKTTTITDMQKYIEYRTSKSTPVDTKSVPKKTSIIPTSTKPLALKKSRDYKKFLGITVKESLIDKIKALSKDNDMSISEVVENILENVL